ncbi:MAG: hypothetical protein LBI17_02975 [Rickettsiales bacterium]|jgi:hypothetical protein|nr:hypothetical protein [Rickettsiales bacterium]
MADDSQRIPLKLNLPKGLGLNAQSRLFIYFPERDGFSLSHGKLFESGLWSASVKEMEGIEILAPKSARIFQFLIIAKPTSGTEAVANAYFEGGRTSFGPFISADYAIGTDGVSLYMRSFSDPRGTVFEIDGVPEDAGLTNGHDVSDTTWEVPAKHALGVGLMMPKKPAQKKLSLSITASIAKAPRLKSTFTLIMNLEGAPKPYGRKYREIRIDAKKMLRDMGVKYDRYVLSVRCPDNRCCVAGALNIENKWLLPEDRNAEIVIRNFDLEKDGIDITASFMAIRGRPYEIENRSEKLSCDFRNSVSKTRDFTHCVSCRSKRKCAMFSEFMDYIGDTTILRHILSD